MPANRMTPISKQIVEELDDAPFPDLETISQVRTGKPKTLGQEKSAIFKEQRHGPVVVTPTGLEADEHITPVHGGTHRAIHQYCSQTVE